MSLQKIRPLIFGEVLFDVFPTEKNIGGAPFNVAWHLKGFGLDPLLYSRIGDDDAGREIQRYMTDWGMNQSLVQRDDKNPTGIVQITMGEELSEHTFDILDKQAYDYIAYEPIDKTVLASVPLLYHGSLIARNETSLNTLNNLKAALDKPVFVDINLRDPWWKSLNMGALLKNADIVKMNKDELKLLYGSSIDEDGVIHGLKGQSQSDMLITLGEKGVVYGPRSGEIFKSKPASVSQIVDTVGAGDSISAVFILGHLLGWSYDVTLNRAVDFASAICENRGGIFQERKIYDDFLRAWHGEKIEFKDTEIA